MKACIDCKFNRQESHGYRGQFDKCVNPRVSGVSPVTGVPRMAYCEIERSFFGRCWFGRKFEPKEPA